LLPLEVLGLFAAASVLLALAPGPDNLFVLTQAALRGPAAGVYVTLGLCTGLLVHTSAVAFGVAALIQASPVAFTALKLTGAAYLLYLAWQAFRAEPTPLGTASAGKPAGPGPAALYRRGVIMNVTNPKVTIFFLAVLPQFIDPTRGAPTLQLLMLGAVFIAATLMVFGGIAAGAGLVGRWLRRSPAAQRLMNRLAALVFVALAANLALAER
jgi:threonine/homoserine/homoserine lactone efflux protein